MKAIFVDTCVWFDAYVDEANSDDAKKLLLYCACKDIPVLFSATSIKDVEYGIQRYMKKARREDGAEIDSNIAGAAKIVAISCVKNMMDSATAVAVDDSDIWLAFRLLSDHNDFEDCLIMAGVMRTNAEYLVTSDKKLIKHAPFNTVTPKEMLEILKETPWTV